jgi:hypothetical protein
MPNNPIPSIVIGLGGTGALTVMHIKQQLLNIYDNEVPPTVRLLVFDTSKSPLAQFQTGAQKREEGSGFGSIEFTRLEFGHIGGDARPMLTRAEVPSEANAYLSSWLRAKWFKEHLDDNLFRLEDGAGQYRQLGRLAVFKDLAALNSSNIYTLLRGAITQIADSDASRRAIAVFFVGSLAGGTGAGTVLDIAFLTQTVAKEFNRDVQMRGYFFLPDALKSTIPQTEYDQAKPRALAALRELGRLANQEDFEVGYPIHYHPREGDPKFRKSLTTKLFGLVYLIDGDRPQESLANVALWKGATASVGDAIMSFMDSHAGEYFRAYNANINSQVESAKRSEGYEPYVSSLGSYTIILPIQQVIDQWAYRLGRDFLDVLLSPNTDTLDRVTALPTALNALSPERGADVKPADEVRQLLEGRTAVIDTRNNNRALRVTTLWQSILTWSDADINNPSTLNNVVGWDGERWLNVLRPSATDTAADAERAGRGATNVLRFSIEERLKTSNETDPQGNPSTDHARIAKEVNGYFDKYLGIATGDGTRRNGDLERALRDLVDFQRERFYTVMNVFVDSCLNGLDNMNFKVARGGKLGWLSAVVAELLSVLNEALLVLRHLRTNNPRMSSRRAKVAKELNEALTEMQEKKDARGFLGVGNAPAIEAQRAYRTAANDYFDVGRIDAVMDGTLNLLDEMIKYVSKLDKDLKNWQNLLAFEKNSVYGRIRSGLEQLQAELNRADEIRTRRIIRDEAWFGQRYSYYTRNEELNNLLGRAEWRVVRGQGDDGLPRTKIQLFIDGVPLRDETVGDWSQANLNAVAKACRAVFERARQNESILQYLATKYPDRERSAFVREIEPFCQALLRFDAASAPNWKRKLYVSVNEQTDDAQHGIWLKEFMTAIREQLGVNEEDETAATRLDADDRFRMTLISMAEILPMRRIEAYRTMLVDYMRGSTTERELMHIFPAEVNAVRYEDALRELNQQKRILGDKVVVFLDNLPRFREFHALLAHRLIAEDKDYRNKGGENFVYFLTTPPIDPTRGNESEEWWLTEPAQEPSLLQAAMTYVFRANDYGYRKAYDKDYTKPIEYAHVAESLNMARQEDTDARLEHFEEEMALYDQDLFDLLTTGDLEERKVRALARVIVEHDMLKEHADRLEKAMLTVDNKKRNLETQARQDAQNLDRRQESELQELYDFYALSLLVVREMIAARRKDAYLVAGYRAEDIPQPKSSKMNLRDSYRRRDG